MNIIIIIILLLVVVVVKYISYNESFNNSKKDKLKLYSDTPNYRIGDVFKFIGKNGFKIDKDEYNRLYPNSIATMYINKCKIPYRFKCLKEIIMNKAKKTKNVLDRSKTAVVHLRTGDCIECDNYNTVDDMLNNNDGGVCFKGIKTLNNWSRYVKPISYFRGKIRTLKEFGITDIYIISGSHRPKGYIWNSTMYDKNSKRYKFSCEIRNFEKYIKYIKKISELFIENDFNVIVRTGNNPDDDLVLATQAKIFIPTGGGYSSLLSKINSNIGNIVLNTDINS